MISISQRQQLQRVSIDSVPRRRTSISALKKANPTSPGRHNWLHLIGTVVEASWAGRRGGEASVSGKRDSSMTGRQELDTSRSVQSRFTSRFRPRHALHNLSTHMSSVSTTLRDSLSWFNAAHRSAVLPHKFWHCLIYKFTSPKNKQTVHKINKNTKQSTSSVTPCVT